MPRLFWFQNFSCLFARGQPSALGLLLGRPQKQLDYSPPQPPYHCPLCTKPPEKAIAFFLLHCQEDATPLLMGPHTGYPWAWRGISSLLLHKVPSSSRHTLHYLYPQSFKVKPAPQFFVYSLLSSRRLRSFDPQAGWEIGDRSLQSSRDKHTKIFTQNSDCGTSLVDRWLKQTSYAGAGSGFWC